MPKTKQKAPILPSNLADPNGTDRLERGAMREFDRRMRRIARAYKNALDRIPAEPVVNRRYVFELDRILLEALYAELGAKVDDELVGQDRNNWFLNAYVEVAYERGTSTAYLNMARQSPVYEAGRSRIIDLLRSQAYGRRIALTRARVFEDMKGLSAGVKADMGRVLADGVGRGLNPREIAKNLNDQAGIEARRAHRIARTEVPMALKRARWDEEQQARDDYGIRTLQMHISALSPTTRPSHAERHAKLYTVEQVRDWYSTGANAINCKCGQVAVMVNEKDEPLVPEIVEKARATYKRMKAKGKGEWTQ